MGLFSGPWLRVKRVPKELKETCTLTQRDHKRVVALLAGRNSDHLVRIPAAALRAVGVSSTDDLEIKEGAIVLRPRTRACTEARPEASS